MARVLALLALVAAWCSVVHSMEPSEPIVQTAMRHLVQSLPHARRRALLQSEQPGCVWNGENKKCSVSPMAALGFLQKAPQSSLKDIILSTVTCHFKNGEDACMESGDCKWDKEHNVCEYTVDMTEPDSFKRCVGDAGVFLESAARGQECAEKYTTKDSCNISNDCGWEPTSEICAFDTLKSLTGVPSMDTLPRGVEEILTIRGTQMAEDLIDADFEDAEEILTWDPPPFACPDGVDQVLCHVAQQGDEYIKLEVFCASQMAAQGICDEDERCFFDDTIEDEALKCRLSRELEAEGRNKQREVFLSTISNPTAVAILRKEYKCLDTPKESCKGDCLWNKEGKSCDIDAQVVIREMAKHPLEEPVDASCELVKEMFSSGCLELSNEKCGAENRCMWDKADGLCVPGPLALADILFKGDQKLKNQATELFTKCHATKAEADCV